MYVVSMYVIFLCFYVCICMYVSMDLSMYVGLYGFHLKVSACRLSINRSVYLTAVVLT